MASDSKDISISKEVLPDLPSEYEETSLGDKRRAKKQYRSLNSNVHVREYDDNYTIHIDHANPRVDPIGHLLKDAPESIAAAATSLYFARRSLERSSFTNKKDKDGILLSFDLLKFFSSFLFLNVVFRWLKELIF